MSCARNIFCMYCQCLVILLVLFCVVVDEFLDVGPDEADLDAMPLGSS
jgi:hypothetical protein